MISKEDSMVIHRDDDDQFQYESRFDEYTDVLNQDINEHTEESNVRNIDSYSFENEDNQLENDVTLLGGVQGQGAKFSFRTKKKREQLIVKANGVVDQDTQTTSSQFKDPN